MVGSPNRWVLNGNEAMIIQDSAGTYPPCQRRESICANAAASALKSDRLPVGTRPSSLPAAFGQGANSRASRSGPIPQERAPNLCIKDSPTGWVFSEGISRSSTGLAAFCTPLCGEYWKAQSAPILSLTLTLRLCTMSAWTSVRSADNVRILY